MSRESEEDEEINRLREENFLLKQQLLARTQDANTVYLAGRQFRQNGDNLQRDYFRHRLAYAKHTPGYL